MDFELSIVTIIIVVIRIILIATSRREVTGMVIHGVTYHRERWEMVPLITYRLNTCSK